MNYGENDHDVDFDDGVEPTRALVPLGPSPGHALVKTPPRDVVRQSKTIAGQSQPLSKQSDAFWRIRNEISARHIEMGVQSFAILSAERDEGRSYVAANLAYAISQQNQKVLLIDADLRNPCQHEIFDVPNEHGLSLLLTSRRGLNLMRDLRNAEPLSVLSAGSPEFNPAAMLGSSRFRRLLDRAEEIFDIVLIDTPPAEAFADAEAVARYADAAIFVMRKGHSTIAGASALIRRIRDQGTEIAGAILNTH